MCGFQRKLGHITPTVAEIHAIHTDLLLCRQLGLSRIKLYTDSLEAMCLLLIDCGQVHPLQDQIQEVRSLILSNWDLEIIHVYREGLRCVDYLT